MYMYIWLLGHGQGRESCTYDVSPFPSPPLLLLRIGWIEDQRTHVGNTHDCRCALLARVLTVHYTL